MADPLEIRYKRLIEKDLAQIIRGDCTVQYSGGEVHGVGKSLAVQLGGSLASNRIAYTKVMVNSQYFDTLHILIPVVAQGGGWLFSNETPVRVACGVRLKGSLPLSVLLQRAGKLFSKKHAVFVPMRQSMAIKPGDIIQTLESHQDWPEVIDRLNTDKEVGELLQDSLREKDSLGKTEVRMQFDKEPWGELVPISGGVFCCIQAVPRLYQDGLINWTVGANFQLTDKVRLIETVAKHIAGYTQQPASPALRWPNRNFEFLYATVMKDEK